MATPRRTDQKARIVAQAAILFAENGYDGTGIQELSDAVGLGRGALYHHIGSKQQLLYDVVAVHGEEVLQRAREILADDLSAADRLRLLSRVTMVKIMDNLAEWTVFFREIGALEEPLRGEILATRNAIETVWVQVIDDGVRAGEFRPVDPVVVKGILGMHNYAHVWIRPRGRLTPEAIADRFSDVILGGLRP